MSLFLVFFFICGLLCKSGFILNSSYIASFDRCLLFLVEKLFLFTTFTPLMYVACSGILKGYFGEHVKNIFLDKINNPYFAIWIFICCVISISLVKYNMLYLDSTIVTNNNVSLVLVGDGKEITLTSQGVDFFNSILYHGGNLGVMYTSLRVIGLILAQHPNMPIGAKLGVLTTGSGVNVISYNVVKTILTNPYSTGGNNVKTTITIAPSNSTMVGTGTTPIPLDNSVSTVSESMSKLPYRYSYADFPTGNYQ